MLVEINAAGSGMDQHKMSLRGTGKPETLQAFLNLAHFWAEF